MTMREDANTIIAAALHAAKPDTAVRKALQDLPEVSGRICLAAIGKAAWQMSAAAAEFLGDRLTEGICITKYGHVMGTIPKVTCYEAGHPVTDENSIQATSAAIRLAESLQADDLLVFLVSGGGSALFEAPAIPLAELQDITRQLLACGADIVEMNTLRKRLSLVKGGKFARLASPARVFAVILSDIIGDPLDMIASGPACADHTTFEDALAIAAKYNLQLSDQALACLKTETPKELDNVETRITGSVRQLCSAAEETSRLLGYEPHFLTASLNCEARDAGHFLAAVGQDHIHDGKALAYICGGETVVHVHGKGLGGRNQELALAAAEGLAGLDNVLLFSLGSDGTDGPTDAAGGIVDGSTAGTLQNLGISIPDILADNDAYHALQKCNGLIITGPTGTNVNDLTVLLIRP